MRSLSARGILPACIITAAAIAAAAAPGAASASVGAQCSGVNVKGQGSSAQKLAQVTIWTPDFNTSSDAFACNGKQGTKAKPTVEYTSTGSGAGLHSFGIESGTSNFGPTNAYIGTDEPPNSAQLAEVAAHESTLTPEVIETLPVEQFAIAADINLPAGCTATSTAAVGRLVLSQATLQGIFAGTVKTWGAIKEGGDTLSPGSCGAEPITVVVRKDQSGTTHVFKRFLNLVNKSGLEGEDGKEHTWGELSEGSLNQVWPKATGVVRPAANGGGEVAAKVASTPGSIGYVALAESRSNGAFSKTGGPGKQAFWAALESESKKGKAKYQDPSTNGDTELTANSNCAKTTYSDGANPFPPPSVTAPWNEVTTKTAEKTYPLCGFTFDVAFTKYSLFTGATEAEATTVNNYLKFVVDKKGGQTLISNHDYLALPKGAVASEAVAGAALIGF